MFDQISNNRDLEQFSIKFLIQNSIKNSIEIQSRIWLIFDQKLDWYSIKKVRRSILGSTVLFDWIVIENLIESQSRFGLNFNPIFDWKSFKLFVDFQSRIELNFNSVRDWVSHWFWKIKYKAFTYFSETIGYNIFYSNFKKSN